MPTQHHTNLVEIKVEVLQIVRAFGLGELIKIKSSRVDSGLEDCILTIFETSSGEYKHYYRTKKENHEKHTHITNVKRF